MIACGALAGHVREIAARRGWPVEVHPLPAPLHNRPAQIAPAGPRSWRGQLQARGLRVALAYADCGSYGALDELCAELGLRAAGRAALLRRARRRGPDRRAAGAPSPAPTC